MTTQIFLAFIEGIALILSPCILPVLPIVLAASSDGGKKRPFGVIAGFIVSFSIFAVLSRQAIVAADIDAGLVRNASLILLAALGLVMISSKLSAILMQKTEGLARIGAEATSKFDKAGGFTGGFLIGLLIGLVWTPCAGPVMAAAVIQIVQAQDSATAVLTVVAFALGAGVPMLLIALFGRQLLSRASFLKKHSDKIRKAFGVIIVFMAVAMYQGWDSQFLAMPSGMEMPAEDIAESGLIHALDAPYAAPEITGIEDWVNAGPLTLESLKGKVVLIDFWTYSCINCVRTLPYITAWDKKYRDKGLVIIGVHTPEFPFEKKKSNVESAAKLHGIEYAIAQDNDYKTWSAFKNRYWPAHYLIDREGNIVYTHFGEGNYDVTEHNIRFLLGIDGAVEKEATAKKDIPQSPETYLGYDRAKNFAGTPDLKADADQTYSAPENLTVDQWALSGTWHVGAQTITSTADNAQLQFRFQGRKVYLVMGTADGQPLDVAVTLDSKPYKTITVAGETLYTLVDEDITGGLLEIQAPRGLQAYAFTFGQ